MLKDVQGKFADAVMRGKGEPFLTEIEEGGKIGPKQRLYIYQHAYKARLLEILEDDFSVLHSLVGDDLFSEICLAYVDHYPSTHPSLRHFGQHMVKFLKETEKYSTIIPAIEMAEFEWTFNDVFDAPDQTPVTVEDVAKIPPEAWTTLRIHLQPSFRYHQFKWNTPAVWSAANNDENQPVMPEEYPVKSFCMQWKSELKCFFRTLSDEEAEILLAVHKGRNFPHVCEILMKTHNDEASLRAAEFFKGWILEGLVVDLEYLRN